MNASGGPGRGRRAIVRRFHGTVVHARSGSVRHRLEHPYHAVLVDADHLDDVDGRRSRVFGLRPAAVLPTEPGARVRERIESLLRRHGVTPPDGRLLGLMTLRPFGIGFDPLTVWWCHDSDGELACVVLDVHNTYRQAHPYVIPVEADGVARGNPRKRFHVSPFLPLEGGYQARVGGITDADGELLDRMVARVTFDAGDGTRLAAVLTGRFDPARVRLRDAGRFAAALVQGVRSLVQIHRHAFATWRRGAAFRRPPTRHHTSSHDQDLAA